jgi:hypothetical protein
MKMKVFHGDEDSFIHQKKHDMKCTEFLQATVPLSRSFSSNPIFEYKVLRNKKSNLST